ncbi:MAG: c-type cytochrome biogenesis protein CcmI [Proteobacteria bacterium]|nr:c-type cytochrome biogenesis protein CcmI [Pseudomonadota bacterium]
MFWIAVIGLLLVASFILVIPIIKTRPSLAPDDRQQQNIAIAREKKSLLETQLSEGEVSQEEFDSAFLDLQTSLALDLERSEPTEHRHRGNWAIWAVLVILPLLSFGFYFQFGEYRVIENPSLAQVPARRELAVSPENMSVEEMVEAVKQRLRDNPEDANGWFILGRTLMSLQKIDQAVTAYQRTYDLVGEDPGVLLSLADALAMQQEGMMAGEPEQLVLRALEISPQEPNGLWLAGLAAEQKQEFALAHDYWTRLLPLIDEDPESIREVRGLIDALEQIDPKLQSDLVTGAILTLAVSLSEAIQHLANENDSVFVYAKAMNGPPMPLAVKRLSVAELPARITLSDDDAMVASMKLSSFDEIIVGARVSKSGNPVAQVGDLYFEIKGVDTNNLPPELALSISLVK